MNLYHILNNLINNKILKKNFIIDYCIIASEKNLE